MTLALQIHDAELSALLHRGPILKHSISEQQRQASTRSFAASTASEWASAAKQHDRLDTTRIENHGQSHSRDLFHAYVKLEGLGVMISDNRRQNRLDQAAFDTHQQDLLGWYELYAESLGDDQPDQICVIALWHWTYMALLVDLDQLESAIGRDGPEAARDALPYVTNWATTPSASRCMLHAYLMQKQFQSFRFKAIPAIHAPRILFSAAIAWYCYIQYGQGHDAVNPSVDLFDASLPEFRVISSSIGHLSHITSLSWSQGTTTSIKMATLCE